MKAKSFPVYFLALLTSTSLAADFKFFEPLNPPRPFQVMVHRGEAEQAPENTRPALQRCIEDLFEWAEVDVRLTKDGQHVLCHDSKLDRVSNGTGLVKDHTLDEVLALDAGSGFAKRYAGTPLLSFKQCLELAKGKLNLYLDCKDVNPEQLANEILQAGMEQQVIVFDKPDKLQRVRKASKGKVAIMPKWHPAEGTTTWVDKLQPDAVEIDANEITPAITKAFHDKKIKVQTKNLGQWDTPEFWDKALAAHVDWIQTDLPEEIIARDLWRRVPKRPVRISLHRGANRYAPENTLPAFAKAIRLGVDFIEFDVRTTSDGKFYLLHDGTLDGKTDGTGPIANTPSSVVASLSAGVKFGRPFAKLGLPTLEEFLTATEGKIDYYFDAKAIPPEVLAEAVERHHMSERTVVYQSPQYLLKLKAINPRIRALPPLGSPEQIDGLAANLKPYAVDASWKILSKEVIDRCHANGILVFSDALGAHETIADYLQAMDWGIDLIQTDHPMRVMRAIELRAAKAILP
ncbi:MAG: glycerophosphodiester phosphodiesterase family protein [Verrucomicrobia bacterium]|nr:glycerophosphodiester phosphodiesterase family protein [Verrucomicrobiota bacterium]